MNLNLSRDTFIKGMKIAFGSAVAIFIARLIDLEFSSSAGIITLLTIQDTKKETLKLSFHRVLSFIISMVSAYFISMIPIQGNIKYSLFLLVIVEISYIFKLDNSISTNAVFGTHIFISDALTKMSSDMFFNELLLLIIGLFIAILMNYKMPNLHNELTEDVIYSESEMRRLFTKTISYLFGNDELITAKNEIIEFIKFLEQSIDKATKNIHNITNEESECFKSYFDMRKRQCHILLDLIKIFRNIDIVSEHFMPISSFLNNIAKSSFVENNVTKRLSSLKLLTDSLTNYTELETKEEFEIRVLSFEILNDIKEFLMLKKEFFSRHELAQSHFKDLVCFNNIF